MKNKKELYLIAQNIRSLFNIGSIFRSADVFGVTKIYLCGYTAAPPNQKIEKVSLGAENFVPWEKHWQTHLLVSKLKSQGVKIYALETGPKTKNLTTFKPQLPCALVVGNEVKGISRKILSQADAVISIPMLGQKESLNVAIAASIGLYELGKYKQ
ncbi:RNA methyltransferase [Candidatus Kuenenbacteria bacterium]|nr:RNA methyltransferase [Candidatus Kuenenbacteria bacterium]